VCGISGIFNYGDLAPVDGSALRRMAASLVHRGPDDSGFLEDGPCGFGVRRLAVIDLQTGHQPILSEDGTRAVILNGEIYNYADLRASSIAAGRRFLTQSDTEIVLAAYERQSLDCPTLLRGMFAFAIWDRNERRLFLARDRVGVKPLYYLDDGRRLIFGSEIKAILAAGGVCREIDEQATADYFALRYIPAQKTIFKAIRKLPPGCWMRVEAGKTPHIRRYWDLRFAPDEGTPEVTWIERLRERLDDAVRVRMVADVPLGAFLSGGVDSSAMVGTMARLSRTAVPTYSIGFDEPAFDETCAARAVAKRYGCDHHEAIVHPDAVSALETLVWHFDEPFADSSAIPTYYVSKMARESVTVALSGDGGDENFGGYVGRYATERTRNRLRSLVPPGWRPMLFGKAAQLYPRAEWLPRPLRATTMLANLGLQPHEAFFNTMSLGCGRLSRLLSQDFRNSLGDYSPATLFRDLMNASETTDPVSRAQYVDIKTFLADDILVKVDRASMAVGLEVREPMLDHLLMETAARIPSRLKLGHGEGKVIFKRAVEDRVPREILARPKHGFEIPLAAWLRGPIKEMAHAALFDTQGPADPMLDGSVIRDLWDRHQAGVADNAPHLWAVLVFKLWAARFVRHT
jgi:asparagine synthase (glutamine-hydrolysing)